MISLMMANTGQNVSVISLYTKSGSINKILLVHTDGALIILKCMHLSDNFVPFLTKV